jgi:hypothetical protein
MNEPRRLFTPPRDSHLIGLVLAVPAYMMMADVAAVAPIIPQQLGFRWQSTLVMASPLVCVFICLVVSNLAPVGNRSRIAPFRAIGQIPVLGRYLVSVGIGLVTLLLGLVALHFLTLSSIQSLELRSDVPFETLFRIQDDLGDGVTWRRAGDETEVFFRKEKQSDVERALENEGIEVRG